MHPLPLEIGNVGAERNVFSNRMEVRASLARASRQVGLPVKLMFQHMALDHLLIVLPRCLRELRAPAQRAETVYLQAIYASIADNWDRLAEQMRAAERAVHNPPPPKKQAAPRTPRH